MRIRIKEAISYFNENREEGVSKMTKKALGSLIDPNTPASTMSYYMTMWDKGEELEACNMYRVQGICEFTGVDADFLFGEIEKSDESLKLVGSLTIHNVIKYSDFTANELCDVKPMK